MLWTQRSHIRAVGVARELVVITIFLPIILVGLVTYSRTMRVDPNPSCGSCSDTGSSCNEPCTLCAHKNGIPERY